MDISSCHILSCIFFLRAQVDGDEVYPNRDHDVLSAGGRIKISYSKMVHHSGTEFISVEADFGLAIEMNKYGNVGYVLIPKSWVNVTEGICGNNDGDHQNDLIDKSGTDRNDEPIPEGFSNFVNSWFVDDPEDPA